MSESERKRQRKRVPVSCLNCKKRKVRCDKNRPCSGCIKNNVAHTCVYLEPEWVDHSAAVPVKESPEYVAMYSELAKTVEQQMKEIRCLRAQLQHSQSQPQLQPQSQLQQNQQNQPLQLQPQNQQNLPQQNQSQPQNQQNVNQLQLQSLSHDLGGLAACTSPVTVLSKLFHREKSEQPQILCNNFFTIRGLSKPRAGSARLHTSWLSLYSWLNSIKVDPQLTSLWYRITSLQKSYHIYKTNLLKGESQSSRNHENCSHHQCPVVACEFNMMLEESDTPGTSGASSKVTRESTPQSTPSSANELAVDMLNSLQKLWADVLDAARNTDTLDYEQLKFLVDYYFSDSDLGSEMESRGLFRFFKDDILALFSKDELGRPRLDISAFSPSLSDAEVVAHLRLKTVYLSMLGIIVDEAIESLHSFSAATHEIISTFRSLFPLEMANAGIGYKYSSVLFRIWGLLDTIYGNSAPGSELDHSLSAVVLLVALSNRLMFMFEREYLPINLRDAFTMTFTTLLKFINKNDSTLIIWEDPAVLSLQSSDTGRQTELRLLFCQVWADFLRLLNNVALNFVPILKHTNGINQAVDFFFNVIPDVQSSRSHLNYLEALKASSPSRHVDDLIISLQVYYSMARTSITLRNGIEGTGSLKKITVNDLVSLVNEISAWTESITLNKLRIVRYVEVRMTFHFLEYLLHMIIFLQLEKDGDHKKVAELVPVLFNKYKDLNRFLQRSCLQFSKGVNSGYVLGIAAETLARVSHLVSGFLIRFKNDNRAKGSSENLVYALPSSPDTPILISLGEKSDVISETDRTVQIFESAMPRDAAKRRTKIWKFYMTFIRNSHKMNAAAYFKLHADAFGAGKLLNECPVMKSTPYETSAARMETGKCPMFTNDATPVKKESPKSLPPAKCPVTSETQVTVKAECPYSGNMPAFTPPSTQKCPFGHGNPESDIRGNDAKADLKRKQSAEPEAKPEEVRRDPFFMSKTAKRTPPLFAPTNMFPAQVPQQTFGVMNFPDPPLEEMDWDSLPNFNFDFMGEEALMMQMTGGELNSSVEGMFQ